LITTLTDGYERISMHGVRRELLVMQATAARTPLVELHIPRACVNEVYEARMAQAFDSPPLLAVKTVAFGDLFLEDVRAAPLCIRAHVRRNAEAQGLRGLGFTPIRTLRPRGSAPGCEVRAFRRRLPEWAILGSNSALGLRLGEIARLYWG
jgi:hypothetical protein